MPTKSITNDEIKRLQDELAEAEYQLAQSRKTDLENGSMSRAYLEADVRVSRETIEHQKLEIQRLREALGSAELVLPPIPMDTKIREASSYGKTVWEYAPTCAGAIGYEAASDAPNRLGRVGGYEHLGEIVERVLR